MIIDSCKKAFSLGFLSYIKDVHTDYSQNCYETNNIDEDLDKELLKYLKEYVDIIYEYGVTSISLKDVSLLNEMTEAIEGFNDFTDDYKRAFVRGIYEYNNLNDKGLSNDIYILKNNMIKDNYQTYMDFIGIPYIVDDENKILIKYGCSSTDFLGYLYNNIDNEDSFVYNNYKLTLPKINIMKVDENAIIPSKKNWSDVGYDLSIIKKVEDYNSKTALYDTGIKIQVDYEYYVEIVPRSSLAKSGYMLANSIGIIDNSYRGNIMVALTKVCEYAKEIEYPFRCCQLILRQQINSTLEEVGNVDKTKRNEGGFGST
jgi:deoxyuridine 5'-triphosphate nucleotidohydrolase